MLSQCSIAANRSAVPTTSAMRRSNSSGGMLPRTRSRRMRIVAWNSERRASRSGVMTRSTVRAAIAAATESALRCTQSSSHPWLRVFSRSSRSPTCSRRRSARRAPHRSTLRSCRSFGRAGRPRGRTRPRRVGALPARDVRPFHSDRRAQPFGFIRSRNEGRLPASRTARTSNLSVPPHRATARAARTARKWPTAFAP